MNTINAILTRRSIRQFTKQSINDDLIQTILKSAMYAPSAGNSQTWQFLVIKDTTILNQFADKHPHAKMAREANVAILVCADLSSERYPGFWVQDCSASVQNILLTAHELGLGAVWVGIHPQNDRIAECREIISLPGNIAPFALIPLGYPNQELAQADRFDTNKIHYDRW